jgi:hypothetical protein
LSPEQKLITALTQRQEVANATNTTFKGLNNWKAKISNSRLYVDARNTSRLQRRDVKNVSKWACWRRTGDERKQANPMRLKLAKKIRPLVQTTPTPKREANRRC